MAKDNRDLRLSARLDLPLLKNDFREGVNIAREAGKDMLSALKLKITVDPESIRAAAREALKTIGEDSTQPRAPRGSPSRPAPLDDSTPPPSPPRAPKPEPEADGGKVLDQRVAEQEKRLAELRDKYRGDTKKKDRELTEVLIKDLTELQDKKRVLLAAGVGLTDKAAKAELAARKSALDQEIGLLRRVASEKDAVVNEGAGAKAGILGLFRKVEGADIIGSLKSALPAVAIGSVITEAVGLGSEFQAGVAELSAITGVAGDDLDVLAGKARNLATEFGGSASGNVEAFKGILSKLGPDIAKNPAALEEMTRAVNTLSAATGDEAAASMDALTTGLLQFQVDLSDPAAAAAEMTKQMNVMAAGAQFGAAEVPQVADAIKVAGVAASGAKVSFEETNASLQALAAGGKVGAEAGTALRNVISKLGEGRFLPKDTADELKRAGVDISKLGDQTVPLTTRLRELQKITKDSALFTKLFGSENAAAAAILVRSVDSIDELKQQISGTNTAFEQAEVRQQTFSAQMGRFTATVKDGLIGAFQAVAPALTSGLGAITAIFGGFFSGIAGLFSFMRENSGAFLILAAGIGIYAAVTNAATIGTYALSAAELVKAGAVKIATFAQTLWNAAMSANPIGVIILGVTALVATIKLLSDAMEETTEDQIAANEAEQKLVEQQKQSNQQQQQRARTVVQLADEYERLGSKANRTLAEEKRLGEIQNQLNGQYPGLISGTKSFGENLAAVKAQAATARDSIKGLQDEMVALDKKSRELAIRNLALQSELAFNGVVDSLSDGLPGLFTQGTAEDIARPFMKAINAAKTDPALQKVINDFQQKVFDLKAAGELDAEETAAVNAKIAELATARFKLLAALRGDDQKKEETPAAAPAAPEPKKEDPKEPENFEKQRAQYTERARQIRGELAAKSLLDEKKRIEADAEEKRRVARGQADADIQALRDQAAKAEKEGRRVINLDVAIKARGGQRDAELDKIAEDASDQINALLAKRLEEEQKAAESAVKGRSDRLKSELEEITANQERINDTSSRALAVRLEKQKEIDVAERELIHISLVSQNREYQAAFKERQSLLDEGKLTEEQFQTDIRDIRAKFAEQLKDDPALKAFDAKVAKDVAAAEREIRLQVKREKIAEEADLSTQRLKSALLELEEQLAADLEANRLNESKKLELLREYAAKRKELYRDYLRETNILFALSISVEEGLREASEKRLDDKRKEELEKKRADLDRETKDLEGALLRREIGYRTYYEKLRELAKKRVEIEHGSEAKTSAIGEFFRQAGIAAAARFEKAQLDLVNKARQDYVSAIARREQRREELVESGVEKEEAAVKAAAETEAEIQAARTAGLEETVTYASAQFLSLVAQGENAGTALAASLFDALQASIPAIVAGIFGQSLATLGPILGPIASAGITAAFYALVGLAKGAIIGRKDGGIVPGGQQLIWINERGREEFVVNDRAVHDAPGNRAALEWTNRTNRPLSEYFAARMTIPTLSHVVVTPSGKITTDHRINRDISRAFNGAIAIANGLVATLYASVGEGNRAVVEELQGQTRELQQSNKILRQITKGPSAPPGDPKKPPRPRPGGEARENHHHQLNRLSR